MLPADEIERQRTLDLGMVVRARGISAGTPGGAYQADVLRSDLEGEVPRVAQPADRSGPLAGVQDWSSVDATTIRVRDARRQECPGTGEYAAIKGHTVLSVGGGAPVRDHFSPAREHDRRHLAIDEAWRGSGLLADLGEARRACLRAGEAQGVRGVIRLQDHWTPKVDAIARGQVSQTFFPGAALDALLAQDILRREGRAMDADVHGGGTEHPLSLRLIGVHTPKGDGFFRTNLPPRIGPRQVADLYRGRGEVERRIRLDQSVHRLDEVDAAPPCSLKTLLHASLIASTLAALLAHTHHLQTRPPQAGAPRTEAPLHPRRLALQLAVACRAIAHAFDLRGAVAAPRWDKIAALLTHSGQDPNGRRRPSAFDQLRGWKRQPVVRRPSNHHDLKAVA